MSARGAGGREDQAVVVCPRRTANVKEFVVSDEKLLYRPGKDLGVTLNQSARAIWELCDGRRTIDDIVSELGRRLGCADTQMLCEIHADVINLVEELHDLGLVDNAPTD
jgi:Coenzyme PQQ synthesis protein D (PqqD)